MYQAGESIPSFWIPDESTPFAHAVLVTSSEPNKDYLHNLASAPSQPPEFSLIGFQNKYEIHPKWLGSLEKLVHYDSVLVLDDSGSMNLPADPDVNYTFSRWEELKRTVQIIVEAHELIGVPMDIYFLNRGIYRGISNWSQISHTFSSPPSGFTNIVNILNRVYTDHVSSDMQRNLTVHILTDGHPTDFYGNENIMQLTNWLTNRWLIDRTFFSIILCTDDEEVVSSYRYLEYNPSSWNRGVPGVDVTEDYRGELRDVQYARGSRWYRFTFGDYVVKTLVGAIDPTIHLIDLPDGCSFFNGLKYCLGF